MNVGALLTNALRDKPCRVYSHEVEIVRREPDGSWSREIARKGEVARLTSIECELPVDEIYRDPLA